MPLKSRIEPPLAAAKSQRKRRGKSDKNSGWKESPKLASGKDSRQARLIQAALEAILRERTPYRSSSAEADSDGSETDETESQQSEESEYTLFEEDQPEGLDHMQETVQTFSGAQTGFGPPQDTMHYQLYQRLDMTMPPHGPLPEQEIPRETQVGLQVESQVASIGPNTVAKRGTTHGVFIPVVIRLVYSPDADTWTLAQQPVAPAADNNLVPNQPDQFKGHIAPAHPTISNPGPFNGTSAAVSRLDKCDD